MKRTISLLSLLFTVLVSSGFAQLTFTENSVSAGVNDGGAGQGIAFADYNNDGYEDIYVVNHDHAGQPAVLYLNNGDESFFLLTAEGSVSGEIPGLVIYTDVTQAITLLIDNSSDN